MGLPKAIDGFVLGHRLGEGALAEVYEGVNPRSGKKRAFKFLKRELAAYPESADILLDEARRLSQIRNTRVVAVLDAGLAEGRYYVALELLDGPTLEQRLQAPPPPSPEESLSIVEDLLDALTGVHETGLVHCEVEPTNLFRLGQGESLDLCLAGFAQSRKLGEEGRRGVERSFEPYCAPEQMEGGRADFAFDVFSAGVLAHRLLSGATPPLGWQRQGALPALGEGIPAGVRELIGRMASVDPVERPTSEDALIQVALLRGKPRPPKEPKRSLWARLFGPR